MVEYFINIFTRKKHPHIKKIPYKIDQLDRRQGTHNMVFANGKTAEIGNYKNDLKEGLWLQYWNDGTLKRIIFYYEDKLIFEYYRTIGYSYGYNIDVTKIYGNNINKILLEYTGSPNAFDWELISSYQFLSPEVIKKYKNHLIPEILNFFQNKDFFQNYCKKNL